MSSLQKKFIINFIWQIFGQFGYLLISLVGNIILARLLDAYEFGIIGILMFFVTILKVFTESGLSGALIRKGNPTNEDYSTIFIFNLVISLICYSILFISAPFIADFYHKSELILYIKIIGLILIINAFQFTQNTRLVVQLKYKLISNYAIIANLIATIVGIILAYTGYGIWSLIWMQILNVFILTLIYWIREGGYSKLIFNKQSFSQMYKFGMYTTFSSLLNTVFENSYQLIISKYFSINLSGYYFQGKKLQEIPIGLIKSTTTGVVFSTLSKYGKDEVEFSKNYTKICVLFTVLVGCICLNLFLFSKEAVLILYGPKWIEAVFYIKVLAIGSFFFMQEMLNRNIFKVFDKTDRILFLEIIKKIIQAISIVIGIVMLDIKVLMYGFVVTSFISFFINYRESRKIFKKSTGVYEELTLALKVFCVMMVFSFGFQYIFDLFQIDKYLKIILFAPITTIVFLGTLNVFKIVEVKKLLYTIKNLKK